MRFATDRNIPNDQNIWLPKPYQMKVKTRINGESIVFLVDASHAAIGIRYLPAAPETRLNLIMVERLSHTDHFGIHRNKDSWAYPQDVELIQVDIPDDPADYPFFVWTDYDQSQIDEPATETIIFPPLETVEQFFERIHARLLDLTRRIRILRHEEPHQNALSTRICREVPENHDEVLRYDIACNLIKRPVGWLALQLQTYQTRYNSYLATAVKAKEAGTNVPPFNRGNDETKIEAMLEKLETHLTEECLENHFDLHDHGEWDKIQNKQRKITLCNDDYSPGEVLVDVNSFFTDGDGNIAETHAKRTYHDISTKYWVKAKRTPHRNLVTERTVEL